MSWAIPRKQCFMFDSFEKLGPFSSSRLSSTSSSFLSPFSSLSWSSPFRQKACRVFLKTGGLGGLLRRAAGRATCVLGAADPHVSPPPPSLCSCKYSHCNDDDQLSAQPTLNRESFQIETPNGDICWLKKARNCDKTKFAMSHFLAFFSYRTCELVCSGELPLSLL